MAVVVGAALGFLVAPSSHKAAPPSAGLTQAASAGPLSVHFPAGWRQSGAVPSEASSLKLSHAVTLAPVPASGGALVLGTASAVDSSLLPSSFTGSLSTALQGTAVKLGAHTFRRYLDLIPQGAPPRCRSTRCRPPRGTAIAACVLPQTGAPAFSVTCERIVSSLQAPATLPLTANAGFASALGGVVAKLNRARASGGRQLAQAKTPRAQSSAAGVLARAYTQAAGSAAKLQPGPIGVAGAAAVVAALRRLGAEYRSLAAAASH